MVTAVAVAVMMVTTVAGVGQTDRRPVVVTQIFHAILPV
jgi:hypothetical protein